MAILAIIRNTCVYTVDSIAITCWTSEIQLQYVWILEVLRLSQNDKISRGSSRMGCSLGMKF